MHKIIQDLHIFLSDPSVITTWHAYKCNNAAQSLNRIVGFWQHYEVQLNQTFHAEKPHIHGNEMGVYIVFRGYTQFRKRFNSGVFLEEAIREKETYYMGARDAHYIPALKEPSYSVCLHGRQTNWHEIYPPLGEDEFGEMAFYFRHLLAGAKYVNLGDRYITVDSHNILKVVK
jgi:hypothetical protein